MFEKPAQNAIENNDIDPKVEAIVKLIQEKMALKDQVEKDPRFETAAKNKLMSDLQLEITALNDEKMKAIEARRTEAANTDEKGDDDPFSRTVQMSEGRVLKRIEESRDKENRL